MQPIAELEAAPTEDKAYQEGGKLVKEKGHVASSAANMEPRRSTRRRVTNSFLRDYVT